jgi:type II secretory pathway pseudopilin PulG
MPSRLALIILIVALVALPGLAVMLNRAVRSMIRESIQTQQRIQRLEDQSQRAPAYGG